MFSDTIRNIDMILAKIKVSGDDVILMARAREAMLSLWNEIKDMDSDVKDDMTKKELAEVDDGR